jgi:citrate lyase subunit beta / citryl-CoA lyase
VSPPAPPPRSWLYVPATRPELVTKALAGPADAVVIDLEDAVPADAKDAARAGLAAAVAGPRSKPLWVRVNAPTTPWGEADLAAVAALPVDGIRLPKSEDPTVVAQVADRLARPVHVLIETALGVEVADRLARASEWVTGVALGEADLLADLGGSDPSALGWARGRIVVAARAAGRPAPVMSVYTDLADLDGLRTDSERARGLGFFGRSVVHPKQVPVVNAAFRPSADEIDGAHRIVAALERAQRAGSAVVVDERGRFVDAAVVNHARLVLALADHHPDLIAAPDQENP